MTEFKISINQFNRSTFNLNEVNFFIFHGIDGRLQSFKFGLVRYRTADYTLIYNASFFLNILMGRLSYPSGS